MSFKLKLFKKLKKTDIPYKFYSKFYSFLSSKNEFPIDINILVEWNIYDTKNHCKAKLIKNFIINEHYDLKKNKDISSHETWFPSKENEQKTGYFLCIYAFCRMCKLAKNNIGNQIYKYYNDFENISDSIEIENDNNEKYEYDIESDTGNENNDILNNMKEEHLAEILKKEIELKIKQNELELLKQKTKQKDIQLKKFEITDNNRLKEIELREKTKQLDTELLIKKECTKQTQIELQIKMLYNK